MNTFKRQCITLRKKNYTLNEIIALTGRSKTSIYFHIKHISLSEEKLKAISTSTRARARSLAVLRKGKSRIPYKSFHAWSPALVLLVAHLHFDGELNKSCVYNNRNPVLIARVERLMRLVYERIPKRHINRQTGVQRVSYHNVALSGYLREKFAELLQCVACMPLSHQRKFLTAFFDDEGCMDFRPGSGHRQVRGYQKDRSVLLLIQTLLANFGIRSVLKEPNEIVIIGKEDLQKFQKEINFSKGVRINGSRPNSIWKKNIEKRMLLARAIKSFKA